jgi:uncharacterized protein (DUF169 family)
MTQDTLKKNEALNAKFTELLRPSGYLVAGKMLVSPDELAGRIKVRRPQNRRTLCQLIAQTQLLGRSSLSTVEDQKCYLAKRILGFQDVVPKAYLRYVGWSIASEDAARKSFETVPKFEMGKYAAVYLSPLEQCPVEPDAVIFIGNASQMLVLIAAYVHKRGGALNFSSSGWGVCGMALAAPVTEGVPKLCIPGNAWKVLALPSDTDLIMGIPYGLMEELLENAAFMRSRGGSRYPAAWQHIDWDIQPPIGPMLEDDGMPTWLKK